MKNLSNIYYDLYNYYGPQHWWPANNDIEMMIGAILVQNTNWKNVELALQRFPSFHPAEIMQLTDDELIHQIQPAGFYTRKVQTIKRVLHWYQTYDFKKEIVATIPTKQLRKEFLAIHGIGNETCDCILLYAFNRPIFVVDTYLKRLLAKFDFFDSTNYDAIQTFMMTQLPENVALFQEYHALIVAYGKEYLKPSTLLNNTPDPVLTDTKNIDYSLNELFELEKNPIMHSFIHRYGFIQRQAFSDPYWCVVYAIIGQVISASTAQVIFQRFQTHFPTVTSVGEASLETIKSVGLTTSKARYIQQFAIKILNNELQLANIYEMNDDQALDYLCQIKGIGLWSAKIILMHAYQRKDIAVYEDLALRNAVKKVTKKPEITRPEFDAYFDQFAPYRTLAAIYHWHFIANDN
ncbi:hypothetical protein [Candidatus Enterococcus willemsii]|uniref:HhH-GPD domain-containing protein n=1 Tax=Candidatus Enterococcus willemsii TaxID=1857215 RepID=A0ABQ6Z258_9ENTE|nr:hypothetical protein [Enterococcus sp. CU12B]KAF1305695.1 hypothetical protein BAU17_00145 [Enterococcus sp. CU12B]